MTEQARLLYCSVSRVQRLLSADRSKEFAATTRAWGPMGAVALGVCFVGFAIHEGFDRALFAVPTALLGLWLIVSGAAAYRERDRIKWILRVSPTRISWSSWDQPTEDCVEVRDISRIEVSTWESLSVWLVLKSGQKKSIQNFPVDWAAAIQLLLDEHKHLEILVDGAPLEKAWWWRGRPAR